MTDDLQEWEALYHFHCSPFHPFLKAVVGCIWVHRDWDTLTSCPSQSTIGEECGLGRTAVKKYVSLAHELGLFGVTTVGAVDFKARFPTLAKYAKSRQRYSIYTFDLAADIWQERWTKDELAAKHPGAIFNSGSRRRPISLNAQGQFNGSSRRPIDGSSPRPVNGSPLSAETFSFPSQSVDQVATLRRDLYGARSSSGRAPSNSSEDGEESISVEELLRSLRDD